MEFGLKDSYNQYACCEKTAGSRLEMPKPQNGGGVGSSIPVLIKGGTWRGSSNVANTLISRFSYKVLNNLSAISLDHLSFITAY